MPCCIRQASGVVNIGVVNIGVVNMLWIEID